MTTTDPTQQVPPAEPVYMPVVAQPKPPGVMTWKVAPLIALVALVLGFGGGLVSHAAFPAPKGATGPTGPPGPSGVGTPIDLNNMGYCVSVSTMNNQTWDAFYVTNVSISAPTDTAGTLSCPSGQYVSLEPTLPSGGPSGYTPQ
jgi:hypothetical protein